MQVGPVFGKLLLILGHLLDHQRQVAHRLLVALAHPLRLGESLQVLGDQRRDDGDVLVSQLEPEFVVLVEQHLLLVRVRRRDVLVDVVLYRKQVVGHRLQRELVQDRRDAVEAPVQNQKLRAGFLRPLAHRRLIRFIRVQLLLNELRQLDVAVPVTVRVEAEKNRRVIAGKLSGAEAPYLR